MRCLFPICNLKYGHMFYRCSRGQLAFAACVRDSKQLMRWECARTYSIHGNRILGSRSPNARWRVCLCVMLFMYARRDESQLTQNAPADNEKCMAKYRMCALWVRVKDTTVACLSFGPFRDRDDDDGDDVDDDVDDGVPWYFSRARAYHVCYSRRTTLPIISRFYVEMQKGWLNINTRHVVFGASQCPLETVVRYSHLFRPCHAIQTIRIIMGYGWVKANAIVQQTYCCCYIRCRRRRHHHL